MPVEVASHVFTVEFHVYIYHLIDSTPGYNLPKLEGKSNGFDVLKLEKVDVTIISTQSKSCIIDFPERFTEVLRFYLSHDLPPIFFPSYEYHTLSERGVTLKHALLQITFGTAGRNADEPFVVLVPELMLVSELAEIRAIRWRSLTRGWTASVDFIDPLSTLTCLQPFSKPALPLSQRGSELIVTPHAVDLRPKAVRILNQGDLGTCGVCALVGLLEFITQEKLSVLFLYYATRCLIAGAAPHDDAGTEITDCVAALAKYGICREQTWPGSSDAFLKRPSAEAFTEAAMWRPSLVPAGQLMFVEGGLDEFRAVLREGRVPITLDIGFAPMAYSRVASDSGDIPPHPPAMPQDTNGTAGKGEMEFSQQWDACEHSVLLIGYDDETEHFLFQNSWGPGWGTGGFGRLPYDYIRRGFFRNALTWTGELPHTTGHSLFEQTQRADQ